MIDVWIYKHYEDKYGNSIAEHDYDLDKEFETAEEAVEYCHKLAGEASMECFYTAYMEIEGKGWKNE